MSDNTNRKKKITYTDPRARRLVMHAWFALAAATVPTCLLGSYMVGSGGGLGLVGWGCLTTIFALASGGLLCLFLAPRLEGRYAEALAAQQYEASLQEERDEPVSQESVGTRGSKAAFTPVPMPADLPTPTVPEPVLPEALIGPVHEQIPAQDEPVPTAPVAVQQ